jgi:hypothetical protein
MDICPAQTLFTGTESLGLVQEPLRRALTVQAQILTFCRLSFVCSRAIITAPLCRVGHLPESRISASIRKIILSISSSRLHECEGRSRHGYPTCAQKLCIIDRYTLQIIFAHAMHERLPWACTHIAQKLGGGMLAHFTTEVGPNILQFTRRATKTAGADFTSKQKPPPAT